MQANRLGKDTKSGFEFETAVSPILLPNSNGQELVKNTLPLIVIPVQAGIYVETKS